ncbi:MAG: immunoglobulin domain-containing protein [Nibricoccus sp.]
MNLYSIYFRFRWVNVPSVLLVLLLQRMPVLRLFLQAGNVFESGGCGMVMKSVFALAALGAYNSVAGATTFSVTPAAPTSGPAGTQFSTSGTTDTSMSVSFSLSGAPGSPRSWSVIGTLPTGLSVTGGNPVNVSSPYKMTIAGTPTTQGSWTVTVKAWEKANTSGNSVSATCVLTITAGTTTSPPSFTTQPQSASTNVGGSVTFTAAASGSPAPVLQWYHDGTLLSGKTAASLTLANVQTADAGSYTVTATNSAGSVTSSVVVLTVLTAPSITAQPQNATATVGGSTTLSVVASGPAPLSYQWKKGGAVISGATTANYTISNVQTSDAGSYTVTVSNSVGSVTSNTATLTVNSTPSITNHPQSLSVVVGDSVLFSATATGSAPLSYQWQKGGAPIGGATSATYSIPSAQLSDAGNYTVVVTNGSGSVTSNAAILSVLASAVAPSITTQPQSVTVTVGAGATFTVAATGTAPLTYQWKKAGAAINGATSATYTIPVAQLTDAGNYTVVITNGTGSITSSTATLAVSPAPAGPVIATQPTSHSVASGHDVSLVIFATGYPAPTYAWYVSADNGATWTAISDGTNYAGATTSILTVKSATSSLNGCMYRCTATNATGSVNSFVATLTVSSTVLPAPSGLVASASGTLTVTDSSNNTIQTIGTNWVMTSLAGTAGQQGSTDATGAAALFRQPNGIAMDSAGNLYVADTGNSIIRRISAAGAVTTVAGSSSNQGYRDGAGTTAWFNSPAALTADGVGNVYIADSGNAVIRKIAVDGTVITLAGAAGSTGTADGVGSAARFNQPSGIVVDGAGNLFVSDTYNQTIRRVTAAGVVTTLAGLAGVSGATDGPGASASFNQPRGLCLDASGNLYVADTANSAIRKVTPTGAVTTFAGLSTISGLLDGTGTNAWFNQPRDVKIDSSGNLYVADTGNAAIRKITPTGVVTTASLSVASANPGDGLSSSSGSGTAATESGPVPGKAGAGGVPGWFGIGWLILAMSRWLMHRRLRQTG